MCDVSVVTANFQLPEVGQCFDEVEFVELERDEAQKLVEQYNKEGHANLPPDYKRFRGPDRYAGQWRHIRLPFKT